MHNNPSGNGGSIDFYDLASGKLRLYTTVFIYFEKFSYSWMWRPLYFHWRPHFEKRPGIVYPIKRPLKIHRGLLLILHHKLSGWVIDIDCIITFAILNKEDIFSGMVYWIIMKFFYSICSSQKIVISYFLLFK